MAAASPEKHDPLHSSDSGGHTFAWASELPSHGLLETGQTCLHHLVTTNRLKPISEWLSQKLNIGGASDTELALSLGDLANVLLSEGKYVESEVLLDRAIAILRSRPTVDKRQLPVASG